MKKLISIIGLIFVANIMLAQITVTVWTEDCETDAGWDFDDGIGVWIREDPYWNYNLPDYDHTTGSGLCFLTNGTDEYVDEETYILTSPSIDLTDYSDCELSFWHAMNTDIGYDGGFIEAWNGTIWTKIDDIDMLIEGYDSGALDTGYDNPYEGEVAWMDDRDWTRVEIDISDYDDVADFKIRFKFGADNSGTYEGWAIDDLKIIATSPNVTILGSGTSTANGSSDTPFAAVWEDSRHQYIYTASELSTAGLSSSEAITSFAFDVNGKGSTQSFTGFTMKFAHTTTSSFSSTNWLTPTFTTVYSDDYTTVGGEWNEFVFSNTFTWNGTDNIVIEVCFNSANGSHSPSNDGVYYTSASNTVCYAFSDENDDTGCTLTCGSKTTGSGLSGNRPNIAFGQSGLLPVELVSFNAKCNNNIIDVSWSTASEYNNDYFTLEKSSDAKLFYAIQKINGNATVSNISNYFYSFIDETPEMPTYLRLTQTDFDGKSQISKIIYVDCHNQKENDIAFANYYDEYLCINLKASSNIIAQINLFSTNGAIVFSKMSKLENGNNLLNLSGTKLNDAIYILQVVSNEQVYTQKLLIK